MAAEFTALLGLARESVEVEKFVKMIDWATPDADGTSIDLDDPRVQAVSVMGGAKIEVIAGVNLPMLIKLAEVRAKLRTGRVWRCSTWERAPA